LNNLTIEGGTIRSISVNPPAEGSENPFTGNVHFHPDDMPTSKIHSTLYTGKQAYTSLRHWVEELKNQQAASDIRVFEQRAAREDEKGITRAVNWLHDITSLYGNSPERTLGWLAGLFAVQAVGLYLIGGATTGMDDSAFYTGSRAILDGAGFWNEAARSAALPLQATLNPFSHFAPRKLVVAANPGIGFTVSALGIISDILIGFAIFGIRKRLKLS